MRNRAHVMSSFRGQWLPGDPRGFRSRGHRVHSSGDYRKPPPRGEHQGLHQYACEHSCDPISLSPGQRERVGRALVEKLGRIGIPIECVAVTRSHAHALIEVGHRDAVRLFGRAKQYASLRVKDVEGKLWGASSDVVRVRDREHFIATRGYILAHARKGAWTWTRCADESEPSRSLRLGVERSDA